MRYVMFGREGSQEQTDVRARLETARVPVVRWNARVGLVEYAGTAEELLELLGGLAGWTVSEQRVYRLC
ncbi:hypothetical protein WJ96_07480 [Burkholderia ubonensis]|uniref:Uncharacterized protein n=2 Tax=Burkholderia ubonensis TaxID=101571 RepID=A0AAW3MZW2_9BURK|nr:hypothetical protein [Burkholderia ubonensis]KVP98352.1 hypothetical protein WJ96_07480 [Burkholderia ubonensis]KVZ93050.1 hypothetical protein WL25_19140 [Burkholderia ubonensis]